MNPAETCDGIDNNCSGDESDAVDTDTYYADLDADGFGNPNNPMLSCEEVTSYVLDNTDCDDSDADTYPGAASIDSSVECMTDSDGDGYGSAQPAVGVTEGSDCNDNGVGVMSGTDPECDYFYLASNGVTILCPDAEDGATGLVNGVVYTKCDKVTMQTIAVSLYETTCTSRITDMSDLFERVDENGVFYLIYDISSWDVSSVTDMSYLFHNMYFDGDLSYWDLSSLEIVSGMFSKTDLNSDITTLDVSNVSDMSNLFKDNTTFNQDIGVWDMSSVTDMSDMFNNADSFNQDMSG